jgi:hypothetical protein
MSLHLKKQAFEISGNLQFMWVNEPGGGTLENRWPNEAKTDQQMVQEPHCIMLSVDKNTSISDMH